MGLFPHFWIVLPLDDHINHFGEKDYHFSGKTSQGPIQHAVRTCSLSYLELGDCLGDLGWAGQKRLTGNDYMVCLNIIHM